MNASKSKQNWTTGYLAISVILYLCGSVFPFVVLLWEFGSLVGWEIATAYPGMFLFGLMFQPVVLAALCRPTADYSQILIESKREELPLRLKVGLLLPLMICAVLMALGCVFEFSGKNLGIWELAPTQSHEVEAEFGIRDFGTGFNTNTPNPFPERRAAWRVKSTNDCLRLFLFLRDVRGNTNVSPENETRTAQEAFRQMLRSENAQSGKTKTSITQLAYRVGFVVSLAAAMWTFSLIGFFSAISYAPLQKGLPYWEARGSLTVAFLTHLVWLLFRSVTVRVQEYLYGYSNPAPEAVVLLLISSVSFVLAITWFYHLKDRLTGALTVTSTVVSIVGVLSLRNELEIIVRDTRVFLAVTGILIAILSYLWLHLNYRRLT